MPSELFRRFPLGAARHTASGDQSLPYHVYAGEMALIGGWVDAAAARDWLGAPGISPLLDRQGRALAGIWVCEFSEAGPGPHCELQISLAVTRGAPLPAVGDGPFELARLMLLEPGLRLYSAALWNDAPAVVAYNRELLGLDARPCRAHFSRGEAGGFFSFRFEEPDGGLIFQGDVAPPAEQPFWDGLRLEHALGRAGMRRLHASPWLEAQVMAPAGVRFAATCEAQTYLQARSNVITRYKASDARLDYGPAFPARLNFRPAFLEHFSGVEFVYLPPYNSGEVQDG